MPEAKAVDPNESKASKLLPHKEKINAQSSRPTQEHTANVGRGEEAKDGGEGTYTILTNSTVMGGGVIQGRGVFCRHQKKTNRQNPKNGGKIFTETPQGKGESHILTR